MIQPFFFRMQSAVCFGCGEVKQLGKRIREFGGQSVLVVTDHGIRQTGLLDQVLQPLAADGIQVRIFADVEPDPCLDTIHKVAEFYQEQPCDVIVAVGGGSPMDAAKGGRVIVDHGGYIRDYAGPNKVPSRSRIPLICIPTTAGSGSETTIFAVLNDSENNIKITVASPHVAADLAIIDPLMMVSAPPSVTAGAGIDALAHAVEAYVSPIAQPPTDAWALAGIELISQNLRTAVTNGPNLEARTNMAMGSLFSSMAFCNAKLGLAHSLGVPLSGMFHVNHGLTIALFLPCTMEYNMLANLGKYRRIALAMGANVADLSERDAALSACHEVSQLIYDIGMPCRFSEMNLVVTEEEARIMAKGAIGHGMTATNPRRATEQDLYELYLKCF